MINQVQRDIVKFGLDFRPILIDVGDGEVWEFTSDPKPHQMSTLVGSLQAFTTLKEGDMIGGDRFEKALTDFTVAMSSLLVQTDQQTAWVERSYGLGPQQMISEHLMEQWSGFPTKEPSPSGEESKEIG